MLGDTVAQLASTRKDAAGAVANSMKGVREAQMKIVGPLMWGEPAKADMY